MEHPRTHLALSWDLPIYLSSKTVIESQTNNDVKK